MDLEQLISDYNMERSTRDSLPLCDVEIEELEENEAVQRYIRLKSYQERNAYLRKLTDDDILDNLTKTDEELLPGDMYFCYGKDYIGYHKRVGGYYIEKGGPGPFRRYQGTRLTKYQNIAKPRDVVIIPSVDARDFEQTHMTIFRSTAVPEEEYWEIRRNMYRKLIRDNEKQKRLVKEPKND